ncbi:MAG: hypothetical protein WKG01_17595 [Kofleriaceae bacterium]
MCSVCFEYFLQLPLRHLLAQPRGAIARGAGDRRERHHARHRDRDQRGGLDHDHLIGGIAERAIDRDHQAIEHGLGVRQHDLLAVAPRKPARHRLVQREIETGHRLAADRECAQHRVEHLGTRRLALAVLGCLQHLVAQDVHRFDHVGV